MNILVIAGNHREYARALDAGQIPFDSQYLSTPIQLYGREHRTKILLVGTWERSPVLHGEGTLAFIQREFDIHELEETR